MAEFQYTEESMAADNPPNKPSDAVTEALGMVTSAPPSTGRDVTSSLFQAMGTGEAALRAMPAIESERAEQAEKFGAKRIAELERLGKYGVDIAESAKKEASAIYGKPEYQMLKMPEFTPSQASVGELITMFTMVNTMAMLAGGGSRNSGMAALASLNGALDGYKKGRQDIYKMEMINFDKNLKSLQQNNEARKIELEKALREVALNKDVGLAKLKEIELQMKGSQIEQDLRLGRFDSAMKKLDMLVKAGENARNKWVDFEARQRQMETQKQIAMMRAEMSAGRMTKTQQDQIMSANAMKDDLIRLKNTFQSRFANYKADTPGELAAIYQERFKNDPAMASWWREYEDLAMLKRHEVFGATLTGGEKDSWRKATIGPGNSSKAVEDWFDERIRQVDRKNAQLAAIRTSAPVTGLGGSSSASGASDGTGSQIGRDIGLNF